MLRMRFREQLLKLMDRKDHWAWPAFSGPGVTHKQLLVHYQQEYLTYVRDFPLFLGRVHGKCPDPAARRLLAENLYEEETGAISGTGPHPELFLEMMRGLGFPRARFERARLLPASRAYRAWLDRATQEMPWVVAAAVVTIFVEGSVNDRAEIAAAPRSAPPRSFDLRADMLVKHHRLPPEFLTLKRAHASVENGHRHAAWSIVQKHASSASRRSAVLRAVSASLRRWLAYRDGVARAAGLVRPPRIR